MGRGKLLDKFTGVFGEKRGNGERGETILGEDEWVLDGAFAVQETRNGLPDGELQGRHLQWKVCRPFATNRGALVLTLDGISLACIQNGTAYMARDATLDEDTRVRFETLLLEKTRQFDYGFGYMSAENIASLSLER